MGVALNKLLLQVLRYEIVPITYYTDCLPGCSDAVM